MLRPEDMTRAVVVGSRDSLDVTIDCLYELGVLHLIDFTEPDEEFKLGEPLGKASTASQRLLKLRSMARSLEIESHKPSRALPVREIEKTVEQALITLDLNTSGKAEAKQKISSLIRDKEAEIRALEPFSYFPVPVEDYEGYESIAVFAGICRQDPGPALARALTAYELFSGEGASDFPVALFVAYDERLEASRILANHGFQEVKLPKLSGHPRALIDKLSAEIEDLKADLARIEDELDKIRKQFADFVVASEEHLSIEVLKAETPLRIATSENSFVIDGWIPTSRVDEIREALNKLCCGLAFVETIPVEKGDEPPVKLRNPKLVRPFEFFMNLVSTPKYDEIDPTLVLFITFPVFFGFMVGDLGFGLGLVALGAIIRSKFGSSPEAARLGLIIVAGGIMASVFGLVVFAEAFGIPFHAPESNPDEHAWSDLASIPIHPMLEKMHDIKEMLAISFVAGWLHLSLGFVFGFFNHIRHSKKHALAKVAWFLLLLGLFQEIMVVVGDATLTSQFVNSTIFSFMPEASFGFSGIDISLSAVVLMVVGVAVLPVTEGPLVLTEVIGVFTNLVSYARLAALAIGKGGMAFAFNTMLLPTMLDGSNLLFAVPAGIGLVVAQLFFVFFLGSLSAGIQAIRLNYVEFFIKFFEGGGTDFTPLSYERKHSVAEG